MTGPLDSPNLTLLLTDARGRPLPADDALDRAAALRHQLRAADFVLSATPATGPALGHLPLAVGGREPAEAITLGAVALAVLPPMLPSLIDFLRCWAQRNQGVSLRLTIPGDSDAAALDPVRLSVRAINELVERLQSRCGEYAANGAMVVERTPSAA